VEVAINGNIGVELPRLVAAEDEFQQILYALEAELDQLDAKLRSGLSQWTGEAKEAYGVAHAQWRAAASEMVKNLAWLHGVIRTARQNYGSARATNLGMWKGR
jgi:WXG100 family type VII secretion target